MEQTRVTSHIIKAIVIAVVLMAFDYFIAHKTTLDLPLAVRLLPTIWMVAGIAFSGIIYSKQNNGSLRFGDIFAHGFKTTAVVAVIMAVYAFIIIKFVFPPTAHDIELNMKALMEQGGMMAQEARRNAEANAKNAWVIEVSGNILAKVVLGLVGSLTGAAIAKKKP